MSIETTWKRIATSGATADGRTIPPQWIEEMAETYDAAEYTALLWFNHSRKWDDEGQVLRLKVETDDKGRKVLFAKIKPSTYLMQSSRYNTWFSSIEPSTKNFAATGKRYLVGLGITNQPASIGTDQLLFSKQEDVDGVCSDWSELSFDMTQPNNTKGDEEAPTWFKKILPNLFNKTTNEHGDDEMTPEQFAELKELLGGLPEAFAAKVDTSMEQHFSQLNEKDDANTQGSEADDNPVFSEEAQTVIDGLNQKITGFEDKFKALEKTGFGATKTPEHDNDSSEEELI